MRGDNGAAEADGQPDQVAPATAEGVGRGASPATRAADGHAATPVRCRHRLFRRTHHLALGRPTAAHAKQLHRYQSFRCVHLANCFRKK